MSFLTPAKKLIKKVGPTPVGWAYFSHPFFFYFLWWYQTCFRSRSKSCALTIWQKWQEWDALLLSFSIKQHFEVSLRSFFSKNQWKTGWRGRKSRREIKKKGREKWDYDDILWRIEGVSRGGWSWKHPNRLPRKATAVARTVCGMGQQGLTSQGRPGVITVWAVQLSLLSLAFFFH